MTTQGQRTSLLEAARKAWTHRRLEDARAAYEGVLRLDPTNDEAAAFLARFFPGAPAPPSPWLEDGQGAGADLALDRPSPWGFSEETAALSPPVGQWDAAIEEAWGPEPETTAPGVVEGRPETQLLPSAWEARPEAVPAEAPALDLLMAEDAPPAPPAPAAPIDADPSSEIHELLQGARELFELADFSGSLELVEKVMALDPANEEAADYRARNEATLASMYESRLGALEKMPRVAINPDEVVWLNIDHRAGFVLAQIDGSVTYDDLFALSGMSRLDTLRILAQLRDEGVITD